MILAFHFFPVTRFDGERKFLIEGNKVKRDDLSWDSDLSTNVEPLPRSIRFVSRGLYFEIPLRLNIQLQGIDALKFSFGQSPTFNFFNTQKTTEYFEDQTEVSEGVDNSTFFRALNFNTHIGFIWEKEMKKGNSFYLFPNFRVQTLGRERKPALNSNYFLGTRKK